MGMVEIFVITTRTELLCFQQNTDIWWIYILIFEGHMFSEHSEIYVDDIMECVMVDFTYTLLCRLSLYKHYFGLW